MSILFAATYPERVSALVLASGAARWPSAPDYPCGRQSDEMMDAIEHLAAHQWGQGDSLRWFAPAGVAQSVSVRQRFARWERMAVSPSALLRIVRMIRRVDVRGVLPAIHMPTLVIQRLDDLITPACHGRYLADHLPQARYFEQPGCHLPWLDDSDSMLTEIEAFLAEQAAHAPEHDRVLATILWAVTDDLLRGAGRQVRAARGRLIRSTSEAILATFDSPVRAIECAVALRDRSNARSRCATMPRREGSRCGRASTPAWSSWPSRTSEGRPFRWRRRWRTLLDPARSSPHRSSRTSSSARTSRSPSATCRGSPG